MKIPRLESQAQIRQPSSAAGPRLESSEAGKNAQLIGESVSKLADQIQTIVIENEITKADTEARRQLKQLELEAETSDNLDLKTYQKRIGEIRADTSNKITLPSARGRYKSQFDNLGLISDFNIRRTINNRVIDQAKADRIANFNEIVGKASGEISVQERKKLEKDAIGKIDLLVSQQVYSKEDGEKLKINARQSLTEAGLRGAIARNPDNAIDDIIAGKFGLLTSDETANWLNVAKEKIARNKKEDEVKRDTLWLDTGNKVVANLEETSVVDLIILSTNEQINPDIASDLVAWKTDKGTPQYESNKDIWMELVERSTEPDLDLRKFQKAIGTAIKNKEIQAIEGAEFVTQIQELFKSAVAFKSRPSLKDQVVGTAIKMFQSTNAPLISIFNMTKNLIEKVKKGETVEELEKSANEILRKEVKNDNNSRIQVKVKSTGQIGTILKNEFNSGIYTKMGE